MQDNTSQPLAILGLLDARIADDPLLVGVEARDLEVSTPIKDQLPNRLFVDLLLVGLRQVLVGVLFDELGKGLVEFAEWVTDSVQLLPHDRSDVLQPFLNLPVA